MKLHILATGSKGNCAILEHNGSSIILDAGVSADKVLGECARLGAPPELLFCGHFHADHSKHIKDFNDKFIRILTSYECIDKYKLNNMVYAGKPYYGPEWTARPFEIHHDAENYGLALFNSPAQDTIAYISDTGYSKYFVPCCTCLIVECNYIDEILDSNMPHDDPRYLRLKKYHMSLARCLKMVKAFATPYLRDVVLVHLSDTNSDEKVMIEEVQLVTSARVHAARAGMVIDLAKIPF